MLATRESDWGDYPVIALASGELAGPNRPLQIGKVATLFLSGLGRKTPDENGLLRAAEPVEVKVNDLPAEIVFAGASGTPGVDQLSWIVPASATSDERGLVRVTIRVAEVEVSFSINAIQESAE